MRRVSTISEMRTGTAWLAGLVATMDAVTGEKRRHVLDPALRDRVMAHLARSTSAWRIPLAPDADEAQPPSLERVRS